MRPPMGRILFLTVGKSKADEGQFTTFLGKQTAGRTWDRLNSRGLLACCCPRAWSTLHSELFEDTAVIELLLTRPERKVER